MLTVHPALKRRAIHTISFQEKANLSGEQGISLNVTQLPSRE